MWLLLIETCERLFCYKNSHLGKDFFLIINCTLFLALFDEILQSPTPATKTTSPTQNFFSGKTIDLIFELFNSLSVI